MSKLFSFRPPKPTFEQLELDAVHALDERIQAGRPPQEEFEAAERWWAEHGPQPEAWPATAPPEPRPAVEPVAAATPESTPAVVR